MKKKSDDMEAAMSALPDKKPKHNWTPEIDRLILKWAPVKGVKAVASVLRIPAPTVENRYSKLREKRA